MPDCYTSLAKQAIEAFVKQGEIIDCLPVLPDEMLNKRAGVFVTIEKEVAGLKKLRGCIGTYLPTRINIAEEVIRNAIAAAVEDYRFGPLREEELAFLSYTVYILENPEPVENVSTLNPKEHGIIVSNIPFVFPESKEKQSLAEQELLDKIISNPEVEYKTGLLLPDLEGIDTAEKQVSIACQKAGINPEKEKVFIYSFKTKKYQDNT